MLRRLHRHGYVAVERRCETCGFVESVDGGKAGQGDGCGVRECTKHGALLGCTSCLEGQDVCWPGGAFIERMGGRRGVGSEAWEFVRLIGDSTSGVVDGLGIRMKQKK